MQIIITGSVPSKKNSKVFSFRGNRPMLFPGKCYQQWHKQALNQLYGIRYESALFGPLKKIKEIRITIYAVDRRKADLTNRAESVMDLLVDAGILEDDNWFICGAVNLKFGGVDRENPRAEIEII